MAVRVRKMAKTNLIDINFSFFSSIVHTYLILPMTSFPVCLLSQARGSAPGGCV